MYKKDLQYPDNHNGVITQLEPDILECEVKWALGDITMNKASGGDGIPVEPFQILKDEAVKVLALNKLANLETVSFHSNPKEGKCQRMFKLLHSCTHLTLKILQDRLHQYVNCEMQDVQAEFRKGIGTRDQTVNICWIIEKAREFQKNFYFYFIHCAKAFDCVVTKSCGKLFKGWEYQTTLLAS